MVCFSVGVSGSIFCVIRSAPMYGYEGGRRGEPGNQQRHNRNRNLLIDILPCPSDTIVCLIFSFVAAVIFVFDIFCIPLLQASKFLLDKDENNIS